MSIKRILLLPHGRIQNANALSSPYTIGFPAMTAWLGAVHALQRKLVSAGFSDLVFKRVGVVCHSIDLQIYKGRGDYIYSIIGTANPLDKDGNRSAFIEEARCHLDVSLLIEVEGIDKDDEDAMMPLLMNILCGKMKIAGGDVMSFSQAEFIKVDQTSLQEFRKLTRKMMPGYALVERRELMVEAMQQGQDALDALLDYLSVKHRSETDSEGNITWTSKRKTSGWLVPIATGFHGIGPLSAPGETLNQRDPEFSHQFAEAVVTLGEFVMPYRLNSLDDLMWYEHYDESNNLYLCQQKSATTSTISV
ncbi:MULTISPECIES: type I-F CRISPR-associated protein Csy2 [unclassified Undibacterium]|uniref:type I-F CRISPR-associated protein Csy2 n=1 Tax=unclassified Undibacterium TaxID=2630295 RepID=UPI002AC97187|nr:MULTISPECIES: type I-F CRISPR-associated protein Csy2 [unclassified Undibacterium]MEB0139125.1 type I-F CRISPR-associated protein Csy2 [Undibacterium sp. CCC2.1]MEB0172895.1 type I-F CRISPR-associated protein Csy2 [Undibacterium sp. CCC1.1]MEB0176633.1 type I-F CRISPR-associated protein Csy2 [Undibacterium sp. CCC3.4]MEB0216039.1 type I-F CRISPR-associated protein Csy2 [Undibacterium sp. 5I2]WPX43120.1 type I-F CRISPR-associated protein Csy2 [Undibacterium sp. CCC3.4]